MMRNCPVLLSAVALTLSACSSEVGLPTDLVEKAATCAVVSASEARSTVKNLDTPLAFDRQSQIIHYALLAGASDPKFSRENTKRVVSRMQTLQEIITGDQWKPLVEPCKASFPQADLGYPVKLPDDPAEAQLTCYALGDFMARAISAYDATYADQVVQYSKLTTSLEPLVEPEKPKRGEKPVSDAERMAKRNAALAVAAKLGPPAKVMDACMTRFPPDADSKKGKPAKTA
jgi:hypothetical protein